ncbi:hypothetical protein MLD38_006917 [Melastoma candidum]|uniref:Uncharacterized protein n=1 Tax=Melastoma candidum TaxID=119954 RepID=A0ACB9RPZ9_9MYRT|nr:hypothetical protein MLD38_006917 [Melastoma candidum]
MAVSRLWEQDLDLNKIEDLCYGAPQSGMIEEVCEACRQQEFIWTPGVREMKPSDVMDVTVLLRKYLSQFFIAPVFSEDDVSHWFLPRVGVVASYVNKTSDNIADFFSYTRQKSRRGGEFVSTVARLFYYATTTSMVPLGRVIRDALLTAAYQQCDFFIADGFMNNRTFLEELRFKRCNGKIQLSLNNYPMDV